jgi:TPR repeat protein
MYEKGEGIEESPVQAFVWFAAASELGNTQAESHLDLLASNLESELLTQAETLAQICIASVFQTCE